MLDSDGSCSCVSFLDHQWVKLLEIEMVNLQPQYNDGKLGKAVKALLSTGADGGFKSFQYIVAWKKFLEAAHERFRTANGEILPQSKSTQKIILRLTVTSYALSLGIKFDPGTGKLWDLIQQINIMENGEDIQNMGAKTVCEWDSYLSGKEQSFRKVVSLT